MEKIYLNSMNKELDLYDLDRLMNESRKLSGVEITSDNWIPLVGEWVVIIRSGCGTSRDDIGLVCKVISNNVDEHRRPYKGYNIEINRDKKGNRDRYMGTNCLRKALTHEIPEELST